MQWLVLKQQFSQSKGWLVASIVGWTVGMAMKRGIFALLPPDMTVIDFFLSGTMGGTIASVMTGGLLLWLLNRKISGEKAG